VKSGGATVLSLFAYLAVRGSCGTNTSTPYDDVDQWLCFASNRECTCAGVPEGTHVEGTGTPTTACASELDCCFVKQNLDLTYTCTCVVTPEDEAPSGSAGAAGAPGAGGETGTPASRSRAARCLEAAAQHDSTTVTAHCPPITLDSSGVCALTFESCDSGYLQQNGLVACCDGLVCAADASGQKICVVQK
jgi:hypothetical protein